MALRTPIGAGGDDEVRFEDLWADHDVLLTWCRRVAGDSALADDMVQEAYLEAFRRLDSLERHESFLPWLATVAKRRGLNELRRFRYCTPTDTLPEQAASPDSDPADVAVQRDDLERLKAALTSLTVRERDLLLRQVNTGASIWELAEFDQSTPASVRSVLGRARAKLRAMVQEREAWVLAPVAGLGGWLRQRMTHLSARMQQFGPQAVVGSDRLGETVTAMAVAVATLAAPAIAGTGPGAGSPRDTSEFALSSRSVSDVRTAWDGLADRAPVTTLQRAGGGRAAAFTAGNPAPGGESVAEPQGGAEPSPHPVSDTVEQAGWTQTHVPEPRGAAADPTSTSPLAPLQPAPSSEPEDGHFLDFAVVRPPGTGAAEVFALGRTTEHCAAQCTMLFYSPDAGSSWIAREANGIGDADTLIVAPGFPDDHRVYTMGVNTGLLLSTDGGRSFAPAPNAPSVRGPVAMSPAFSAGDERILVGSAPPVVYDAAAPRTRPFAGVPPAGSRSFFGFAPGDPGTFFAGSQVHGTDGMKRPGVYRCSQEVCAESVALPWAPRIPTVYVPTWHQSSPTVVAFAGTWLFVSHDGARSFPAMSESPGAQMITDVADDGRGAMLIATAGATDNGPTGGLFSVVQNGDELVWTPLATGTPLRFGVDSIEVLRDGTILAAPVVQEGGLWCSSDGGETWERRCKSA